VIYDGPPISRGEVSLHAPQIAVVSEALASAELEENQWLPWHVRAATDDGIVYFAISRGGRLIGQAMLHDIDRGELVGLVGYHLFRSADRGQGAGTVALSMLIEYGFGSMGLRRLVAITGVNNVASQRIAEKCGFTRTVAREGPHLVAFVLEGR
jgi:RimJ/RimL family protein N-acetyltransferase